MVRKSVRVFSVLALLTMALVRPALADPPSVVYFDVAAPYTLTSAVTGCAFDVLVTTTNSRAKLTTFVDRNGDPLSMLITGVNQYLFTNLSTGESQRFNSSAPARLFIQPDGDTLHAIVTGPAVLIVAPGVAPGFPTFAYTKGRVDMISDWSFATLQLDSVQGTVQDICQLLQ